MSTIVVQDAYADGIRYAVPFNVTECGIVSVPFPADNTIGLNWRTIGTLTYDGNRATMHGRGHTGVEIVNEAPSAEQAIANYLAYIYGPTFYRLFRFCKLPNETEAAYVTRLLKTWDLIPTLRRGYRNHVLTVDTYMPECACGDDTDECTCDGYWQARCTCEWQGTEHEDADRACCDDEGHFVDVLKSAYVNARNNMGVTF